MSNFAKDLQEMLNEKDHLTSQLSDLNKRIHVAAAALIPSCAKYQVGQQVNSRKTDYQITKIAAKIRKNHGGEYHLYFEYYGRKILKNGNLHKIESNLYWLGW